jgi:hypothetical protein
LLWPVNPKTDAKNAIGPIKWPDDAESRRPCANKAESLVEEESADEVIDKSTDFRCWQILLQKSKIGQPKKSRES